MTDNTIFPAAISETFNQSTDWLVGVIDEPATAERALADLRAAGFADDGVSLLHGPDAVAMFGAKHDQQGPLRRILSQIIGQGNDASALAEDYEAEARLGHSLINVYAPKEEQVARAQQIIEANGGHRIHYYGRWVITQLSNQERDHHEPIATPELITDDTLN